MTPSVLGDAGVWVFHFYAFPRLLGAVGSGGLHQGWQGHRVASVCGDDADPGGGAARRLPQADEHGQAAHVCGDGERALRLPAPGEALHGAHHH